MAPPFRENRLRKHRARIVILLAAILLCVAVLLALPVISDIASALRALGGRRAAARATAPARFIVLVPAHDEELLLGRCLASLRRVDYPADRVRIVIVADNCSDATAKVAREAGFECLERQDATRRGKPWAIDWAIRQLPLGEYDAVVIVDADSKLDPGFLRAYSAAGPLADKALQCYNDVDNRTDSALTRMAYVFSAVRFRYINRIKGFAGLNVPMGNGLAVGTGVLRRQGWPAFSICEDWELYAILTQLGIRVECVPEARICSQEARSLRQSGGQRRRWAAGKIVVLREHWSRILRSRAIGAAQKLDAIAELTLVGPAVHGGIVLLLTLAGVAIGTPLAWAAVAIAWVSLARIMAYTALAIRLDPEPLRAAAAFAVLPVYVVWRLAVQLVATIGAHRTSWHRTARHHEPGLESS